MSCSFRGEWEETLRSQRQRPTLLPSLPLPGEVRQVTNSRTKRNRDARPRSISARRVLSDSPTFSGAGRPAGFSVAFASFSRFPVIPRDTAVVGAGAGRRRQVARGQRVPPGVLTVSNLQWGQYRRNRVIAGLGAAGKLREVEFLRQHPRTQPRASSRG